MYVYHGTSRIAWMLTATIAMWLTGCCSNFGVPSIDPTGARIFSTNDSMRLARVSDSRQQTSWCFCPQPAWEQPLTPEKCPEPPPAMPGTAAATGAAAPRAPRRSKAGVPGQIALSPKRLIAPVGSEVVLVSGLCGEDGYLITQQPIEFMLSQDSVGQIVQVSDRHYAKHLNHIKSLWSKSEKLGADYAIALTSTRSQVVTRGTPSVTDDIMQRKGQCWISLTSASQGTSYVTAVASKGASWPQRRETATIYWVDAQWAFPAPQSVTAGQAHMLSTTVKRTATGAPVVGFIVRYEVVDGVPAVLGPSGETVAEVRTDENGKANVMLQPTTAQPGVTQVRMQVIRPPDPNSDAPRTLLGEGFTSITWSAPGLTLRASGPQVGAVGTTLVYHLEVHNPGDIVAQDVVVRDVMPPSLKFISSNPAAQIFGTRAEWRLGAIPPRSVRVIDVNVHADGGGGVRYAFQATASGGLQAEAFVDTQLTRPALTLNVVGPQTAVVGQRIQYSIEVTNTSEQVLENVTINDRFDAGLQHAEGLASPIQKLLGRLDPGQTKIFAVTFIVQRAGQICHSLEVAAPGGQYAQQQVCLASEQPDVIPQPGLEVTKTVAPESRVGASVQFITRVTNTGNMPLTNVRITDSYDPELEPRESSPGWDPAALAAGQLIWIVDSLLPGQSVQRDVLCLCRQATQGATSRVTVTTDENIAEAAQASVNILAAPAAPATPTDSVVPPDATRVDGQLLVDISEYGDPIKIGEETSYVITIKNDRTVPDQDVVVKIELPLGLRFKAMSGPGQQRTASPDGRTVTVSPIREMRAGETLQPPFRIDATGTAAGEQALQVTVTSRNSPQGVTAQETTTVHSQ